MFFYFFFKDSHIGIVHRIIVFFISYTAQEHTFACVKKEDTTDGISYTPNEQSKTAFIQVIDGIIYATYLKGSEITIEVKKEHHRLYKELAELKNMPLLLTIEEDVVISKETREFARKIEPKQPFTACAVVVSSLPYRILANFYHVFHKPLKPFKVFNDKVAAEEWLQQYK